MPYGQIPAGGGKLLTTTEIARELSTHPSAPVRWINNGALLSSGERRKLEAVRLPGGWRVTRQALDDFLEAVTADRNGQAPPTAGDEAADTVRAPIQRKKGHDQARAELAAAGY